MPIDYARRLTAIERTTSANRHLGWTLAFIAGATNAGAFLAVKQYTSHMTGMVSSMADHLALGEVELAASAFGALISFMVGAATTAILVNFAKRRQLKSQFAAPLLLEALLLLLFGFVGARLAEIPGLFVPVTVMLLCFIMGLQNALVSKISQSEIRTTHVTGIVTDIGIELGKLLYWNRMQRDPQLHVVANRVRLTVLTFLVISFFLGGVLGAIGFQRMGYAMTIPLAILLAALAGVPAIEDISSHLGSTET